METIPQDPYILLSFINMKLRDEYSTLSALCDDMDISEQELRDRLGAAGFEYIADQNRFA